MMNDLGNHFKIKNTFRHNSNIHISESGEFIYMFKLSSKTLICYKKYSIYHQFGFMTLLFGDDSKILLIGIRN